MTEFFSCYLKCYCYLEWKLFWCCSTSDILYQLLNDINTEISSFRPEWTYFYIYFKPTFLIYLVASLPNYYLWTATAAFRVSSLNAVLTQIFRYCKVQVKASPCWVLILRHLCQTSTTGFLDLKSILPNTSFLRSITTQFTKW